MKRTVLAILAMLVLVPEVFAGTIDSNGTYRGQLLGVAVGFFGNVGVGLPGANCNNQGVVVLLTSNPLYKETLATLLSAQATGQNVVLNTLSAQTQNFGGINYCVITQASLGAFPLW